MPVNAKLTITLKAEEVVVAESDDAGLWQNVLSAITGTKTFSGQPGETALQETERNGGTTVPDPTALGKLAAELGLGADLVQGAFDPTIEAPFIHIDAHCWSNWNQNVPSRGRGSIAVVSLVATLLVLWCRNASLDAPGMEQVNAVLSNLSVTGSNPARSINNCEWLQTRNGKLKLNPARIEKAIEVARAFCAREKPDSERMS